MDLAQLFFIIFAFIVFEFSIAISTLFFPKYKVIPGTNILALLFICYLLLIARDFVSNNWEFQNFRDYHRFIFLFYQIGFVSGPLVYFFLCKVVGIPVSKSKYGIYLHFLPFIVALGMAIIAITRFNIFVIWRSPWNTPLSMGMCIINLYYILISSWILKQHDFYFPILNPHSKQMGSPFNYFLLLILLIFWIYKLSMVFYSIYCSVNGEYIYVFAYILFSLFVFFVINALLFNLLVRPDWFINRSRKISSFIEKKDFNFYIERLTSLLENDKIYKNPDLTIKELSIQLDINSRYLSHIINNTLKKSFTDLINSYRIKECQLQLLDNPDKTVQEIMFEAGFSSKSVFNSLFKDETGVTPKEFRQKFKNS